MMMDSSVGAIRNLRVALVLNNFLMGGSERQAVLLAGDLARRGADPVLLGLGGVGPVMDEAGRIGVRSDAIFLRYPLSFFYFPFNLVKAGLFFRRHRPDVILGYTSVPNLYAGWLWKCVGARLFVWGQRDPGLYRPPLFLEKTALRAAGAFIANSQSGMDFAFTVCENGTAHSTWIPNAVEVPPMTEWKPVRDSVPMQVVCVAHGSYPKKGHEVLLNAWRIVQQSPLSGRPKPQLILAGHFNRGEAYADRIRSLAAAPDLSSSVQFAGAVESVFGLLRGSAIGVLSSWSEGMPNAVLEYMAAGLPVVATDLPGIRHALGEGAEHWLIPAGNQQALADRILELLGNSGLRKTCGQRNREHVVRNFGVEALGDRTVEAILKAGGFTLKRVGSP